MLFSKKKEIVGVDVGSSAVKLVQLRAAKGGYQLQKVGMRGFFLRPIHGRITKESF